MQQKIAELKTKIEIKNRFTNRTIIYAESESVKSAIKEYVDAQLKKRIKPNLSEANLSNVDLKGIDLRNVEMSKADLSNTNLSNANLKGTDLRYSTFSYANLSGADMRYSKLSGANFNNSKLDYASLEYADLTHASLECASMNGIDLANTDLRYIKDSKRFMQIVGIGSAKRMTTYCFDDDVIWCDCFRGNLQEFEDKVKATHNEHKQYLDEYIGFINYLKFLKQNATENSGIEN